MHSVHLRYILENDIMNANRTAKLNKIVATYVTHHKGTKAAATELIAEFKAAGIPIDRTTLAQPLMHAVAVCYGVKLIEKSRGTGVTWLKDTASMTACSCHTALMRDLFGTIAKSSDELEVPAEMQALANKLVAMAAEWEKGNKLMATAIANAKAK